MLQLRWRVLRRSAQPRDCPSPVGAQSLAGWEGCFWCDIQSTATFKRQDYDRHAHRCKGESRRGRLLIAVPPPSIPESHPMRKGRLCMLAEHDEHYTSLVKGANTLMSVYRVRSTENTQLMIQQAVNHSLPA